MKSKVESISLTISASEAIDIINALIMGTDIMEPRKNIAAVQLKELLQANFTNNVLGVHRPRPEAHQPTEGGE